MNGKGALFGIVMEFHLGGIETSFTFDEVADGGIFDDHFGPERVARETEKECTAISGNFDDDVGPAGDNMFGFKDVVVGESVGNDLV